MQCHWWQGPDGRKVKGKGYHGYDLPPVNN